MKGLILAAGMGTRLRPMTDSKPKCLVEVNCKPIIFKQIENLVENNIDDITIVAGYKHDVLQSKIREKFPFVKVIVNDKYETTNNMYSAYMAHENFSDKEFLLMNGDVFYDKLVITELKKNIYVNSIVVEKNNYIDENMKVTVKDNRIQKISKQISQEDAYGVSIDVYKFSKEGGRIFFNQIIDYVENKQEKNQWTEVALNDILSKIPFTPCHLVGRWIEIDNNEDLKKAECIFND